MKTLMKTRILQRDERGFASIVIALTLVMILALLTVGFAQLVRREQRNALNKQLAVQAQYAAESGINDAVADIKANHLVSNTDCTPDPINSSTTVKTDTNTPINGNLDVSYTCVSVNLDPTSLQYTNVPDGAAHTVTFSSANTQAVKDLTITWTSTTNRNATGTTTTLKPKAGAGSWVDPALLEISIVPLNNLDRASMTNADMTIYAYPVTSPSDTPSYGNNTSAVEGTIQKAHCSGATCSIKIDNLNLSGAGVGPYLLHITDHYDQSNIQVTGTDTASAKLKFHGAQAVIDSTGRARGVLKRLQVHVPLVDTPILPNYAIEATNVCKRMQTSPAATTFVDTTPSSNGACDGLTN